MPAATISLPQALTDTLTRNSRPQLSPNLHCAVCRLPRQERLRGNAAKDNELFMERFLNPFTARAVYMLILHIEKSFVRNTAATERCLLQNRARHGCVSLYQQAAACGENPACTARGAGRRITDRMSSAVPGLSRDCAVCLLRVALATMGYTAVEIGAACLNHAVILVHSGATVHGLKFESRQTPNRTGKSRSYQNSFGRVAARGLASTQLGPDGLVQSYRRQRIRKPDTDSIIRGSVHMHGECYVHIHVPGSGPGQVHVHTPGPQFSRGHPSGPNADSGGAGADRSAEVVLAVEQVLRNAKAEVFAGTQTIVTQEPAPSGALPFEDMYLVPLPAFQAQLLMLTAAGDVSVLRFKVSRQLRPIITCATIAWAVLWLQLDCILDVHCLATR